MTQGHRRRAAKEVDPGVLIPGGWVLLGGAKDIA